MFFRDEDGQSIEALKCKTTFKPRSAKSFSGKHKQQINGSTGYPQTVIFLLVQVAICFAICASLYLEKLMDWKQTMNVWPFQLPCWSVFFCHFQCIQHRALNPDDQSLPDLEPVIARWTESHHIYEQVLCSRKLWFKHCLPYIRVHIPLSPIWPPN